MSSGWPVEVPEGYVVSRWRVGVPIAAGSWGSVYEAWPAEGAGVGDAPAAVKFIPTGTVTQRQLAHLADMARREREAYRQLRHPRLLGLFEAAVIDDPVHPGLDGAVALVTERARESLADVIGRADGSPVPGALEFLAGIAEGLGHMHAAGWVHGDLKPGNVLVMADGSVRLADFGLSAELDGTHGYMPPAGSCDYLPPEHWAGLLTARGVPVRESADIWAFGVIGCQLLTGHLPFPGATARARAAAAAGWASSGTPAPRTDGLPPRWRRLVEDCLASGHDTRREMTAPRLLETLRELREEKGTAGPDSSGRRGLVPWRLGRRGRRRTAFAAALAVAAVTAGSTAWVLSARQPDYSGYFKAGTDIPAEYKSLIVQSGTTCRAPGISPALVAAIMKAESGFDPDFSSPATRSYGIAGWTPSLLGEYMDPPFENLSVQPAMTPSVAIPAVGRYLCYWAPTLERVPGDHAVIMGAFYYTSTNAVLKARGVPPEARGFAARVQRYLHDYQPAGVQSDD